MKKGFTLIELIVVIVIIGILATLGFAQYQRMLERARGAEARSVLGAIRTQCAALWIEDAVSNVVPAGTFVFANLGMGSVVGQIPTDCLAGGASPNYFFEYNIGQNAGNTGFVATATRCTNGGKTPTSSTNDTLSLTTNFVSGVDGWAGSF